MTERTIRINKILFRQNAEQKMRKLYNSSSINTIIQDAVNNAERCAELLKEVKSAPLIDKLLNLYEDYWSFIEELSTRAIDNFTEYSDKINSLKERTTYAVLAASFEEEE